MFRQKHNVVGLDLGSDAVKLVALKGAPHQWRLLCAHRCACAAAPNSESDVADTLPSPERLKEVFQQNRGLSRDVVSSFRGRPVMIQYLDFPKMSHDELRAAVELEAGEFVTGDLSQMDVDFQVLSQGNGSDKCQVMLVMVPKEVTERRLRALHRAGLNPVAIDIDGLALANAYLGTGEREKKGTVILLNVGATVSNLCILRDQALYFVRDINFGGSQITRALAQATGLAEAEAEQVKCQPERWAEAKVNMESLLQSSAALLADEVRACIAYCRSRTGLAEVDRLLLTGGSARLRGLDEFLCRQLGMPVQVWAPIDEVAAARKNAPVRAEESLGPCLTVALGLAMR